MMLCTLTYNAAEVHWHKCYVHADLVLCVSWCLCQFVFAALHVRGLSITQVTYVVALSWDDI